MRHLQNIIKITTEKEEEEKMFSLCYDSIEVLMLENIIKVPRRRKMFSLSWIKLKYMFIVNYLLDFWKANLCTDAKVPNYLPYQMPNIKVWFTDQYWLSDTIAA